MVVKVVATPCMQWSPQNLSLNDAVLVSRTTPWLATMSSKLTRSRSFEYKKQRVKHYSIPRACSASFDGSYSSDEEFSRKIQDLALRFQLSDDGDNSDETEVESNRSLFSQIESHASATGMPIEEPPDWNPVAIEMKANCVDLPVSLRMIKKKKKQWKEGVIEAGESAYCSVKKAFSSMVFIIRELHSYSLQMREVLFYEDLQGILVRVQKEMHASFVWLFQQVFSHTPTLMVYVMILLANFTVHSMSSSAAFAAAAPPAITATVEVREHRSDTTLDSFKSVSATSTSSGSKTTSVGGNSGGGNKFKPVASGMDGDGWMNNSSLNIHRPIVSDSSGVSQMTTREEESVSVSVSGQEEMALWNSIVEEASKMQAQGRNDSIDSDVRETFVSPVTAKIEADDYEDYFKTELLYQTELAREPNNVLLLANYAQFLYLVVHDYDRAEQYFKRATKVEPKDAEAHNKYANFLWQIRSDLWAAEETFLEAISADPSNSFYAANYAHFLWNTGGEDTCFPLDSPNDETLNE